MISNFLASTDIKVFGRTYVSICNAASDWLRTFLHPGCFCLAYDIHGEEHDISEENNASENDEILELPLASVSLSELYDCIST